MSQQPVSELSNEMSFDIDLSAQIQNTNDLFSGYKHFSSLYEFQSTLFELSQIFSKSDCKIIFSGCGTSGRLAFLCSQTYNSILKTKQFDYCIAGHEEALIKSIESAEDKPIAGVEDLKSKMNDFAKSCLIGITCGMSAPYVAGQLWYHHLQTQNERYTYVVGFNPLEMARNLKFEHWNSSFFATNESETMTFQKCLQELLKTQEETHKFTLLNPAIGPECIAGSSRMKGGSATKIILDVAFANSQLGSENYIPKILQQYEATYHATLSQHMKQISTLLHHAQQSLKTNHHIYYLGFDQTGFLGLVDASECVPTYGAKFTDVRGFVNTEQFSMPTFSENVSIEHFLQHIYPQCDSNKDTIIVTLVEEYCTSPKIVETLQTIAKTIPSAFWLVIKSNQSCLFSPQQIFSTPSTFVQIKSTIPSHQFLEITIPYTSIIPGLYSFAEYSLKLILNCVSTGAHILKGMVYHNRMINVRVTNNKLYYRAVGIVQSVAQCEQFVAQQNLLRAIYDDKVSLEICSTYSVEHHIQTAMQRDHVVPIAILLSKNKVESVTEAKELIKKNPIVRQLLLE